jgi:purine-binding chemotaxis protein CheW
VKLEGGTRLVSILSLDHMFGEDVMKRVGRAAHTDAAGEAAVEERTFLVFTLAGQAYGLAIQSVEEVARMPETVTRLPHAPAFLRGVINLRGVVLPIVDQRQRLNLSDDGADGEGRLIVVKTRAGLAGLAVDTVQEVLRAPVSAISPPPASASGAGMVEGVLNLAASSQMILLLDPAALLNNTETGLLDALGSVNEAPPSVDQSARS